MKRNSTYFLILNLFINSAIVANVATDRGCNKLTGILNTTNGKICGIKQTRQGEVSYAYLGIPYAKPPVNQLRWQPPQPLKKDSSTIYHATTLKSECTQPSGTNFTGSEDCLYLNIWRPTMPSKTLRPVMVYIPGGGFVVGSGGITTFNGTYFSAKHNLIFVTMNYRLGSLGYLRYRNKHSGIDGNFGILDQQAAMRWVKANIKSFGGDPNKITLFGQSAGAMSVGLHLFSIPTSQKLFRAALMESDVMSSPYASIKQANKNGDKFVSLLCQLDHKATAQCPANKQWLDALPLSIIMKAENLMMPKGGIAGFLFHGITQGTLWEPIVGVQPVLGQAYNGYLPTMQAKPYAFGFNRNEGVFFVPNPGHFSTKDYVNIITTDFGKAVAKKILNYSIDGQRPYNPQTYKFDEKSGMTAAAQAMAKVLTHYGFSTANIEATRLSLKKMQAAKLPVYGYYFTQHSSFNYAGFKRCGPEANNICHTEELPYVFHNLAKKVDGKRILLSRQQVTTHEEALADQMNKSWAGFATEPLNWKQGWGYSPMKSTANGPYIQWSDPIKQISDLEQRVNYAFWLPILNQIKRKQRIHAH